MSQKQTKGLQPISPSSMDEPLPQKRKTRKTYRSQPAMFISLEKPPSSDSEALVIEENKETGHRKGKENKLNQNQAKAKEQKEKGSDESNGEFYKVERIVGKDLIDGVLHYEVKWKGFPESDNTWEPMEHLEKCGDEIKKYEKSLLDKKHNTRGSTTTVRKENEPVPSQPPRNFARSSQIRKKQPQALPSTKSVANSPGMSPPGLGSPSRSMALPGETTGRQNKKAQNQLKGTLRSREELLDLEGPIVRSRKEVFKEGRLGEAEGLKKKKTQRLKEDKGKEQRPEDQEEGNFERDQALKIKAHKFLYPLEGDFIDSLLFEVEWQRRSDGFQPANSYQSRKLVKKHCSQLLVEYYEIYMDYDRIN